VYTNFVIQTERIVKFLTTNFVYQIHMEPNWPLRIGLDRNRVSYWLYLILFAPLIVMVNLTAVGLDNLDRRKGLTMNYEVICKKKL